MSQAIWRLRIISVAAAILASAVPAFAACNKTVTVTEHTAMKFGTVAPGSGGGNIVLSATGGETVPSGFVALGGSSPAAFKVTGTNNCAVNISFTPGNLLGGGPPAGQPMTVTNFTTNAGPNPTLRPPGGQLTFSVGATLVVNPAQASGNYAGTYSVTVTY